MTTIDLSIQPKGTCGNLMVTCDRFNLPNSDAHMCRRGDVMYVKPDDHNPRAYCLQDFPVYNYPGMSHAETGTGNLKLWWRLKAYPGTVPGRKARCTVFCMTGNYVP